MTPRVTIVMYHFVRDLANSRYPRIKGLNVTEFVNQLEYITNHYEVVRMEDVIAALDRGTQMPDRSLLLTFDDGYADHYETVFPLLNLLGVQGSFFPPARAVLENKVLDVNKIHFLLAVTEEPLELVHAVEALVEEARHDHDLHELDWYRQRYAQPNRWDTADVIFVKRMLQHALPEDLRVEFTDKLFTQYVTTDERAFAQELYMSLDQLKSMLEGGMHIGSHSYDHMWLNTLPESAQEQQVLRSMEFLSAIGVDMANWTMCYPYGGYDESLKRVLLRNGCRLGLTTEVAVAELNPRRRFELARLDTNDLPKVASAPANEWTRAI